MNTNNLKKYSTGFIIILFILFSAINKLIGWSWINSKEALPKYSDVDYNTEEISHQWADVPLTKKGDFTFQQIKSYLQDTLTDPEEFKIYYLIEQLSTTDTANFNALCQQLLEKKADGFSILQHLYIQLDEEITNYDATNKNLPNPQNRISERKILKSIFQHPKRNNTFIEKSIIQFGEWKNKQDFSLETPVTNHLIQYAFNLWVIMPINKSEGKTAEERFSPEELETLRILFKPKLKNIRGVIDYDNARKYLSI